MFSQSYICQTKCQRYLPNLPAQVDSHESNEAPRPHLLLEPGLVDLDLLPVGVLLDGHEAALRGARGGAQVLVQDPLPSRLAHGTS